MQAPAFTRRVPPSVLASGFLTVCMCFSWRNTLEALLRGVHAHPRNEKRFHSDARFIEWLHSSKLPVCLFPQ